MSGVEESTRFPERVRDGFGNKPKTGFQPGIILAVLGNRHRRWKKLLYMLGDVSDK